MKSAGASATFQGIRARESVQPRRLAGFDFESLDFEGFAFNRREAMRAPSESEASLA